MRHLFLPLPPSSPLRERHCAYYYWLASEHPDPCRERASWLCFPGGDLNMKPQPLCETHKEAEDREFGD
jgi:hypothetical protein